MWILYGILSAFFAALVAIFGKLGLNEVNSNLVTVIRSVIIAVILVIFTLLIRKSENLSLSTISNKAWVYLFLSALVGAISSLFYFYALKHGNATTVAALDRSSVIFVAVLAFFVLGDSMSFYKIAGVILAAVGVFLTVLK